MGKVPVGRTRPVHVLEHAACVVGHLDAQELLHARVPRLRQVGEGELARHQLLLQLEAEDDVQRVRDLVGIDPDQAGQRCG